MSAKLVLEGTGAGAVRAIGDLHKAFEKVEKGIALTAKEAKALEVAAGRIAKSNEAPQERYNRKVAELDKLLKAGKISADDAAMATSRYGQQLEKAGQSGTRAMGGVLSSVQGTVTGMFSLASAAALATKELNDMWAASQRAAQVKLDVAGADRTLRENLVGLSPADQQKVLKGSSDIASRLNLDEAAVKQALASTVAAAGDADLALAITETAGRFTRDPTKLPVVAGAIADVQTATGIKSPDEALGLLALAQGESRITDPAKFAEALPKALAGITAPNVGGSPQAAAGLLATISKGSADVTGAQSATSAINLAQKLDAFFDKQKGGENLNTDQEIQALLDDSALAQRFIDSNTFEAGTAGAISKLFLEQGATRNAYVRAHKLTGDPAARIQKAKEAFNFLGAGSLQIGAESEQVIGSTLQQIDLGSDFAFTDKRREEFLELRHGLRGGLRSLNRLNLFGSTGGELTRDEAITDLQQSIGMVERGQVGDGTNTEELSKARSALEKLVELQEKALAEAQAARDDRRSPQPPPQPHGNGRER